MDLYTGWISSSNQNIDPQDRRGGPCAGECRTALHAAGFGVLHRGGGGRLHLRHGFECFGANASGLRGWLGSARSVIIQKNAQ